MSKKASIIAAVIFTIILIATSTVGFMSGDSDITFIIGGIDFCIGILVFYIAIRGFGVDAPVIFWLLEILYIIIGIVMITGNELNSPSSSNDSKADSYYGSPEYYRDASEYYDEHKDRWNEDYGDKYGYH